MSNFSKQNQQDVKIAIFLLKDFGDPKRHETYDPVKLV